MTRTGLFTAPFLECNLQQRSCRVSSQHTEGLAQIQGLVLRGKALRACNFITDLLLRKSCVVFAAVTCVCRVQCALGNSYCTLSASIMLHHSQQIVFCYNYIAKSTLKLLKLFFSPYIQHSEHGLTKVTVDFFD